MSERNLDFDSVIDRKGTKSLKYDFAVKRGKPADVLPLWVADMDFKTSSYVTDALHSMADHGIFGYSESEDNYFDALKGWMKRRHNWDVEEKWITKTPGIVYALAMAVQAYTEKGDGILIQQPVYYPFSEVINDNERKLVNSPLVRDENGRYHIDYNDFENKITSENVKLFILCNPHNPVGRVWTADELNKVGEICLKHGVIVVSDEIHFDFVFEGTHHVFSTVNDSFRDISVICTSPSKTFNVAGLQVSNIIIENTELRRRFRKQLNKSGYSQVGLAGLVACEAAYKNGDEWLDAVLAYIKANAVYTRKFVEERLPKVKMSWLEGTYLVWLDFNAYGLADSELNRRMLYDAGLWLDGGSIFGKDGEGFQRINIACPRETLKTALERIEKYF
jgi:cystathionine beta-lyase